ncbi:MAG: Rrf2 family transcriptional regulator [Acidobacteria bacterium]|jgi:Rrf2 family protein|nr:Rrf2 family transcriptional regulator [Acidobacteriota bacterium]
MLGISRHTDYAARIVLHLSSGGKGALFTTGDIARRRLIPPAFIRRIVSRLSAAGILKTTRGCGGGIALARPASKISLLDVVVAMEGGLVLNTCTEKPERCTLSDGCAVRRAWVQANAALETFLDGVKFSSLVNKSDEPASRAKAAPGAKDAKRRSR